MRMILLFLSCCSLPDVMAQHCGYDNAAILVVRPHAPGDTTVVDGLRITVLDTNNVPLTYGGRPYPIFFRNTDGKAFNTPGVNHRPQRGQQRLFPFAQDNYVLVIGHHLDLRGCSILVQDERSWEHRNVYRQMVVPLTLERGYPLCDRFDEVFYSTYGDEPSYAPIDIPLRRR
ncbi:MAG: hypothetical protein IPL52_09085 [Flavobacteriales bacterium]|nr:hypothetical protein [Flavobacteriales bacterium]